MHNPTLAAAVLALAAAFPVSGRAEGVTLTFGATIASEYESNGLRQSNGIAFQPSVEAEYRGFYAGIWASNVDQAIIGPGDTFEYDLYAGYRNTVGAFSYDLSYAHYFYNGSGACCGEVILSLGYDVTDRVNLGAYAAWDPNTGTVNTRVLGSFAVTDKLGLDARYGTISNGGHQYWSVGASYAISDAASAFVAYHGTSLPAPDNSLVVAGVTLTFSFP